jgi:hypothetical protein
MFVTCPILKLFPGTSRIRHFKPAVTSLNDTDFSAVQEAKRILLGNKSMIREWPVAGVDASPLFYCIKGSERFW